MPGKVGLPGFQPLQLSGWWLRDVCGAQVRYLKVIEKSGYQALPWVRYITAGGEYEIR